MQKQNVDIQIRETENALEELKKVEEDSDVYKTAGNLLIKVKKDGMVTELEDKLENIEVTRENCWPPGRKDNEKTAGNADLHQDAMQGL